MTVLTKPSLNATKPDDLKSALVDVEDEDVMYKMCDNIENCTVHPEFNWKPPKQSVCSMIFMTIMAILLAVAGITCGIILCGSYLRSTGLRYQGYTAFCSVPYAKRVQDPELKKMYEDPNVNELTMPLQWSQSADVLPDVGADPDDMWLKSLREEFDIRGRVERIRVYDSDRSVSFIHDFDANLTGIVDQDRCFQMELNPDVTLAPETMILGIEKDGPWDVSLVHSTLRALLPAIEHAHRIAECLSKPTYQLEKVEGTIRKRSADLPPHDYVHFAGQKVQEIEIDNLADILQHEQAQAK